MKYRGLEIFFISLSILPNSIFPECLKINDPGNHEIHALCFGTTIRPHSFTRRENEMKKYMSFLNNDLFREIEDSCVFVDPAFELWFNKQYYNKTYLNM